MIRIPWKTLNYVPEIIRKTEGDFKDEVASLFKTKIPKKTLYGKEEKLSKPKTKTKYEENIIRRIKNFFKLKKESEAIKVRIIRVIRTLFEKEDDYYKQTSLDNFWNNNYIKYKSNSDRNKNLLIKEYLNKIKPNLRDMIIDSQKSCAWKVQLCLFKRWTLSLQKMLVKSV